MARRRNALEDVQVFEGISYCFERKKGNKSYWHCQLRDILQCPGRGRILDGVFRRTQSHSHPIYRCFENIKIFQDELLKACRRQRRDFSVIYESLAQLHPEAAEQVDKKNMIERMRRQRKNIQFPVVNSPQQFKTILDSEEFHQLRWYGEGNWTKISLLQPNMQQSAIIFTDEAILNFVQDATVLYILTVPLKAREINTSQAVIVGAVKSNHLFLSFLACLSDNSDDLYGPLFTEVARVIATPEIIFTNYDHDVYNVLTIIFPNCTVKGSYHSFCNSIYLKAQSLEIPDDDNLFIILKKLMALPLFPANKIRNAFHCIQQNIQDNMYLPILDYVEEMWLMGVGVDLMSCFNDFYAIADGQRILFHLFHNDVGYDTSIWTLLMIFQKNSEHCCTNIQKILTNKQLQRSTLIRTLFDKTIITRLWNSFLVGPVNEENSLTICCNLLTDFFDYIIFKNQRQIIDRGLIADIREERQGHIELEEEIIDDLYDINPNVIDNGNINRNNINQNLGRHEMINLIEELSGQDLDADDDITQNYIKCVICKTFAAKYAVDPCGHFILCHQCLIAYLRQTINDGRTFINCPVCRQTITNVRRIYIPS